jgi:hypothetical protein
MALPQQLPGLSVMPQAPNVDPRMFASDPAGALAASQAGLHLGTELAGLQNFQQKLELEKAEIAAKKSQNEYQRQLADHAVTTLPSMVQTQLDQYAATRAQLAAAAPTYVPVAGATVAQANASSLGSNAQAQQTAADIAQGLPQFKSQLSGLSLSNEANVLNAATPESNLGTSQRIQTNAAAQTLGGYGLSPGESLDATGSSVPIAFRKLENQVSIDPITGNTVSTPVTIDSRNGSVIQKGAPVLTKLGTDEKSVLQSSKDITAITSTIKMTDNLQKSLEAYAAAGGGGIGQATATNLANSAPTGPMSVIKKALAAKAQTAATVAVAGDIQNLKNTLANELFGSALTKEESQNLQGMLPTAEDLADPVRAQEKLKTTRKFLETKLQPYKDRGLVDKLNKTKIAPPLPQDLHPLSTTSGTPGQQQQINGNNYVFVTLPDGRTGWKRQ